MMVWDAKVACQDAGVVCVIARDRKLACDVYGHLGSGKM
jgi:hypothetical protein